MQKISPLKAGLEAFNRFKAARIQSKEKVEKANTNSTNPFGISFKGTMIQMDVFESSKGNKTSGATNPILNGMEKINKFTASAKVAAMNKIESIKKSAISFGNKVKENVTNVYNKLATTEVSLDFFKNSTSSLQKRPTGELEEMLKNEIKGLEG